MYRFFNAIASRKLWFSIAAAAAFGMFALAQVSFRTGFRGVPGLEARPELPDSSFSYGSARLVSMMDALGEEGRAAYLRLGVVDTVFPVAYGIFLAAAIVLAWGRLAGYPRIASVLLVVPLAGAASDLAENAAVRSVISLFRAWARAEAMIAVPPFAARVSGWLTTLKWSAAAFSALLALAGCAAAIAGRRFSRDRAGMRGD